MIRVVRSSYDASSHAARPIPRVVFFGLFILLYVHSSSSRRLSKAPVCDLFRPGEQTLCFIFIVWSIGVLDAAVVVEFGTTPRRRRRRRRDFVLWPPHTLRKAHQVL